MQSQSTISDKKIVTWETLESSRTEDQTQIVIPKYSTKESRYFPFGWNYNQQQCYTPKEEELLRRIQSEYNQLSSKTDKPYFDKTEEKHWWDWWRCVTPAYNNMLRQYESESFTLPNRDAKDAKTYPLWQFADKTARQIANWQSERVKDQDIKLMNDPVMLVFEELRDWFFNVLSSKECKQEDLDYISKRQSYIKNLIHLIPNFGPDRLHLQEIQHQLEDASKIVLSCIANKELPQLLSDTIRSATSLEQTIGSYLHFLYINEPVSDNFSEEYLEGNNRYCRTSPVCKVFYAVKNGIDSTQVNDPLTPFQKLNSFYQLEKINDIEGKLSVKSSLHSELVKLIQFPTFAKQKDKESYIQALALLESLKQVRETLENFRNVQSSIGTYFFAMQYLNPAKELVTNYINLVMKSKVVIGQLILSADNGLQKMLSDPERYKNSNHHFEVNLKTLETKLIKDTTLNEKLEEYSRKVIASMGLYKQEMERLVSDVHSGKASREVEKAMREVFVQINQLNAVMPAVLGEQQFTITNGESIKSLPITSNQIAVEKNQQCFTDDQLLYPLESSEKIYATIRGEWDVQVKRDAITKAPIYTYRLFNDHLEIGSAEYYGQRELCVSKDRTQHNILKTTGIFANFPEPDLSTIKTVCEVSFPTTFDKMKDTAMCSTGYGVMRGASHVLNDQLTVRGYSPTSANLISQSAYFSSYFITKYFSYYQQEPMGSENASLNAMYQAVSDTGQALIVTYGFNKVGKLLDDTGTKLVENNWGKTGFAIKQIGSLLRFGVFATSAVQGGVVNSAVSLVSGTVAETGTEMIMKRMLR